jgi:hypothetical protein
VQTCHLFPTLFKFCLVECATTDGQITPLMFMFDAMFSHGPRFFRSRGDLDSAMSIWVSTLYDSGVNLKSYGLRESLIWGNLEESTDAKTEYTGYSTRGTRDPMSDYYFGQKKILDFNYSSFPEDWRVMENEPTDEFAGEFWLMLDRKVEVMPGSWIE